MPNTIHDINNTTANTKLSSFLWYNFHIITNDMPVKLINSLHLPNAKPIVVGIIYRPPSKMNFLEITNIHFSKLKQTTMKSAYLAILTLKPLTSKNTMRNYYEILLNQH